MTNLQAMLDLNEVESSGLSSGTFVRKLPKLTRHDTQESGTLLLDGQYNHSDRICPVDADFRYQDKWSGFSYCDTEKVDTAELHDNKVISLFSGAGGMDLGLEMAGFSTSSCIEIDGHCRETLRHNRPAWNLNHGTDLAVQGDIRNITVERILESSGLEIGEAALIVGGPPCQPFSNIGKKLGAADELNGDLSQHFMRMVKGCLPRAFIFENVAGFHQGKHRETLDTILEEAAGAGYSVTYTILNTADYGVPQQRKRFLILGLRGNRKPSLPFPTHFNSEKDAINFYERVGRGRYIHFKPWKTVSDAFGEIQDTHKERSDYALMNISPMVKARMAVLRQGENFKALPMEMRPNCWKNGKHQGQDTFGRLREDRPSVTIRTAAYNPAKGMYIHPYENRGLSSHEMAALQSFPAEWEFRCVGSQRVTLVSVGKQIGNAVPPLLARAVGLTLKAELMAVK